MFYDVALHSPKITVVKAFLRPLYHSIFRLQLRVRCWLSDIFAYPVVETGRAVPPALLRYRVGESLSATTFVRVGKGCSKLVEERIEAAGVTISADSKILDFGCGCGRTIQWLLESYPAGRFSGADVDASAIDWCGKHIGSAKFVHTQPEPPLPWERDYFDVVYCFSVFTHLDETMQDLWLPELRRILRPGGLLIVSVHSDRAARELGDKDRELLRSKGFVHLRSRKLNGIVPEWYNTTWHSQGYIVDRMRLNFTDIHYTVIADGIQDLVDGRKPEGGSCGSAEAHNRTSTMAPEGFDESDKHPTGNLKTCFDIGKQQVLVE